MPLLFLLFLLVPLAELYVIIQVGQAIGVWWTIALLLADSVLGTMLMRSQGRAAWRRMTAALTEGRPPAREALDGALVILGGALLLAPGFITDLFGALLLLPPTRAAVRGLLLRRLGARVLASVMTRGMGGAGRPPRRSRPEDVEGTAVDVDPPTLGPRP